MAKPTCDQCKTPVLTCRKCLGDGRGMFTECAYCGGTGLQCPAHEERWQ